MSKELELYKAFIDGLVERKDSMTALWVKGDGFPKTEDNKAKNDLLAALTPEQKAMTSSAAVTAMRGRNKRRSNICISTNIGTTISEARMTA